jgi:hypothetical protein
VEPPVIPPYIPTPPAGGPAPVNPQPLPPRPADTYRVRRRGRAIAWAIIAALIALIAGLLVFTGLPQSTVATPASVVTPPPSPIPTNGDGLPVAPGTADTPTPAPAAGTSSSPSLNTLSSSLGIAPDYHELRVYAGYTVSSGAVESSDEELQTRVLALNGQLLSNVTDNQGGPTVIHAELTFLIPQSQVVKFLQGFSGDYQEYGKQISDPDRSADYENAKAQNLRDQGTLTALTKQRQGISDPQQGADLDAQIGLLQDQIAARKKAIDAADAKTSLSRLTILLDERHEAPPSSLQSAWLLGTRNVIAILTGLTFIVLTISPILILTLPLWLMRRRIARALRLPVSRLERSDSPT